MKIYTVWGVDYHFLFSLHFVLKGMILIMQLYSPKIFQYLNKVMIPPDTSLMLVFNLHLCPHLHRPTPRK